MEVLIRLGVNSYPYAFVIGSLLFSPLWAFMYWKRRDLRQQMLFMSLSVAILGAVFEYLMWTLDWWKPETVTGTRVGVEIFILGFMNGGIGAVLYEFLYQKKLRSLKEPQQGKFLSWLPFAVGITAIIVGFYLFGLHSFWATLIGTMLAVFLMLINRLDLLVDSLVGGVALLTVVIPVYVFMNMVFPGVISNFWLLDNLSGILIMSIPLEDLIFYFTSGMMIAPAYEYIFRKRVVAG